MEIYLVRHTIPDIAQGICYGQTDIALSAEFEQHAKMIIKYLPRSVEAVFSSPLLRCTLLAKKLPYSLNVHTDSRLLEMNFGEWEMKKWDTINSQEPWFADYINTTVPGGESYYQLYIRVTDFLKDVKKSRLQKVVIITHGGVIKAAMSALKLISLEEALMFDVQFGSIHHFFLDD